MTSARRFEQDVPALLDDLYVTGLPDYRDDLLRATAATRQRPGWSFPTRYFPMDIANRRRPVAPLPWRALAIVALLLLVAAAAVLVTAGSRPHLPAPFGPARNGPLAYTQGDAIYARDSITSPERLLIGGDGTRNGFWGFSPDGTKILFQRTMNATDHLWVADADGRNQRQILDEPLTDSYVAWSPDAQLVAVTTGATGHRRLLLARTNGSAPIEVSLAGIKPATPGTPQPTDIVWRPPDGAELLVRASAADRSVDFYRVRADGTVIGALGLPDPKAFGPDWDISGPSWSPTGDRLAYNQVEKISQDPGGHFRVHVVRADGTADAALPGPSDPLTHEAWPVWSPDGRSIAVEHFVFGSPGKDWVALLPSDGSAPARDLLPPQPASPDGGIVKAWLPDGTRLIARANGFNRMYSIDPVGDAVEEIHWSAADLPDSRRLAP